MHWNYRIVQKEYADPLEEIDYEIHEVYYDENGEMESMTEQPVSFHASTVIGLAKMMLDALKKPVIVWDEEMKKPVELILKKQRLKGILYGYESR